MNSHIYKDVKPTNYNILVEIQKPKEKVGSIYVAPTTLEKEEIKTVVGKILKLSGSAFEESWFDPKPQVGDKVLFEKFAGITLKEQDKDCRIIKDNQVFAIVEVENE